MVPFFKEIKDQWGMQTCEWAIPSSAVEDSTRGNREWMQINRALYLGFGGYQMSRKDRYVKLETHKYAGGINAAWMCGLFRWTDIDVFYWKRDSQQRECFCGDDDFYFLNVEFEALWWYPNGAVWSDRVLDLDTTGSVWTEDEEHKVITLWNIWLLRPWKWMRPQSRKD